MAGKDEHNAAKRKPNKVLRIIIAIVVVCFAIGVVEFILHPDKYLDNSEDPANTSEVIATTEEPTAEPTATPESTGYWKDNPLDAINLTDDQKRDLYDDVDAALQKAYETDISPDASAEEIKAIEDRCISEVANKYGVSLEDATKAYSYGSLGYLYDIDPNSFKPEFGEMQSVTITGTTLIVKLKINQNMNSKKTIEQNYFTVEDLILNQSCNQFHKISYFAVADISEGTETKLISFDVDQDLIQAISEKKIVAIQMGDYVSELWLHQSLK